jgi:hypothetical protein
MSGFKLGLESCRRVKQFKINYSRENYGNWRAGESGGMGMHEESSGAFGYTKRQNPGDSAGSAGPRCRVDGRANGRVLQFGEEVRKVGMVLCKLSQPDYIEQMFDCK